MLQLVKQKLQSLISWVREPYENFTKAKRESTSKTFQSIAVAFFIGGGLKIFFDWDSSNNWQVVIWLPCAISVLPLQHNGIA